MTDPLQLNIEHITDDLAEKGYSVNQHFLSNSEVESIIQTDEFKNAKLQFKKAGIGKQQDKQINESIRGDYIQWIDPQAAPKSIALYLKRLEELSQYVNQNLFLSLKDIEVHMTIYPVGTFYKRHIDQFKSDDHRKLSVILYLNNDWKQEDGGQLRLYLPEEPIDILPEAGRLVCFRSDLIEHEVMLAKRERLSITGWLTTRK
ncbi:MAG: 2OG-Fe(II) oxygenase [Cyclobacteriaceae bacterium]|nr:2OG-Fe(II) oxygenase [Cyclobacteriaceae bacterium]